MSDVESTDTAENLAQAVDTVWLFISCVLVILMQAGFAAYEVGAIRKTSTEHILLKNVGDAAIAFAAWFFFGYAISQGKDLGGVTGSTGFLFIGGFDDGNESSVSTALLRCVFGWAFAATCITIVSGAIADRVLIQAYFMYSFLTAAFFYPIVAHAAWGEGGLFSSHPEDNNLLGCGVLDFAGSGVVHMMGGCLGLALAKWVEPREARFFRADEHISRPTASSKRNHTRVGQLNEEDFNRNDPAWMTIGTMLLWLGWFGFNCGSSLEISTTGSQNAAGRAALNTTIGGAFGAASSLLFELFYHVWSPNYRQTTQVNDPLHVEVRKLSESDWRALEIWEKIRAHQMQHESFKWPYSTHKSLHSAACNGIVAGLVSITAGCATLHYATAMAVTIIGVGLYHASYRGFLCCKIDDAVGAAALHGVVGFWGLIAAGFFVMNDAREDAGYPSAESCSRWNQGMANVLFGLAIMFWAFLCYIVLRILFSAVGLGTRARHVQQRDQDPDPELDKAKEDIYRQMNNDRRLVQGLETRVEAFDAVGKEFDGLRNWMNNLQDRVNDMENQQVQARSPDDGVGHPHEAWGNGVDTKTADV